MRKLNVPEIVMATHNAGKVREINDLIGPFGLIAKSAGEWNLPEPVEDGTTFEANALIKAKAACEATGLPALSDDSGICVEALDGAPGVYTADWAEQPDGSRDFAQAMRLVEEKLQAQRATKPDQRKAFFAATMCLYWPDGHVDYFRGEAHGHLVWPPRGDKGHGYDPVFQPQGHERTFGEMEPEEKHGIDAPLSHRVKAFKLFADGCLVGRDTNRASQ